MAKSRFVYLQPFPLAPKKSLGLFLENGDQWKRSRMTLTPAFSSGKLRQMFGTINKSVDHLVDNTEEECEKDKLCDVYRYSIVCAVLYEFSSRATAFRLISINHCHPPKFRNVREFNSALIYRYSTVSSALYHFSALRYVE